MTWQHCMATEFFWPVTYFVYFIVITIVSSFIFAATRFWAAKNVMSRAKISGRMSSDLFVELNFWKVISECRSLFGNREKNMRFISLPTGENVRESPRLTENPWGLAGLESDGERVIWDSTSYLGSDVVMCKSAWPVKTLESFPTSDVISIFMRWDNHEQTLSFDICFTV